MTPAFSATTIPALLQQYERWVLWMLDGAGKKAPRTAARPDRNCNATNPASWTAFAKATDAATKHSQGIGFALGAVNGGPMFAGVDLDNCRNPETGAIEPWAQRVITFLDSYTEISPSGTGVKVFVLGSLPDDARQGKVYKAEIYDRERYFTVTGNPLAGTPPTVEPRDAQLRDLHAKLWSKDLVTIVRVFGLFLEQSGDETTIRCPWEEHHSTPSNPGEAGLHLTDGKPDGFHCFHAGCSEKTIGDVYAFFGLRGGAGDFITNARTGEILKGEPDNIRRALEALGCELSFNLFAEKLVVSYQGRSEVWTDALANRIWFAINEAFHFLPPRDLFFQVGDDQARAHAFHPVLDYLGLLRWDGVTRLDNWLVTYGGAEDTPYVRAVGGLTLMAAVRRVRRPGCKFDEMLVMESGQGTNKSSAVAALCPNVDWFSDDLTLGLDAQEVIERTGGKWLIEAAEMKGMRHSDVERLKSFLSRSTDGPARRAYGRISEERPRQFIFIGTTNSSSYLRDSTGNRRYWPVRVQVFDILNLRRDRDQLWAEAAVREAAPGETLRLPSHLWSDAAKEQESRRQDDPWEDAVAELVCLKPPPDNEVVTSGELWAVLAVQGASPHNTSHAARLSEIMERLGYVRPKNGVRWHEGKVQRCWIKATSPLLRDVDASEAEIGRPAFIKRATEN